jgi:hypothetical protein
MAINEIRNTSKVQLNYDTVRNPMNVIEWEGVGRGVPGGSLKGTEAPIRPPVSMPQILPAYRSPVSVPRSVNAPLNNVQIRQSSGVNVGGGMQIATPIKPQGKKTCLWTTFTNKSAIASYESKIAPKNESGFSAVWT